VHFVPFVVEILYLKVFRADSELNSGGMTGKNKESPEIILRDVFWGK